MNHEILYVEVNPILQDNRETFIKIYNHNEKIKTIKNFYINIEARKKN